MKLLKKFQEWREISYGVVEEDEVFLGFLKIGFMEEREREREGERMWWWESLGGKMGFKQLRELMGL